MSRITYDIFDGAGYGLATVTFYNRGVNSSEREIVKIAKSLSDDWSVAEAEDKTGNAKTVTGDSVGGEA